MTLRPWLRGALAGPLSFICSWLLMAGAALYLPGGAAGVDNMVFPIVLFPLVWAGLFLYTLLDHRLVRAYAVIAALCVVHAILIYRHVGAAA